MADHPIEHHSWLIPGCQHWRLCTFFIGATVDWLTVCGDLRWGTCVTMWESFEMRCHEPHDIIDCPCVHSQPITFTGNDVIYGKLTLLLLRLCVAPVNEALHEVSTWSVLPTSMLHLSFLDGNLCGHKFGCNFFTFYADLIAHGALFGGSSDCRISRSSDNFSRHQGNLLHMWAFVDIAMLRHMTNTHHCGWAPSWPNESRNQQNFMVLCISVLKLHYLLACPPCY